MGCCCSSNRKTLHDRAQPNLELNHPIGPPPPYDESSIITPSAEQKSLREPSIISASTTLNGDDHKAQAVRAGVRSQNHSLYCAAAGGHLAEVRKLLEKGFNPSDRTVCDWCPLHWAAHNDIEDGHQIVKLLVEYGADCNQVSDTGLTPLDLAIKAKKKENVEFLRRIGAQTGAQLRNEILSSRVCGRPYRGNYN